MIADDSSNEILDEPILVIPKVSPASGRKSPDAKSGGSKSAVKQSALDEEAGDSNVAVAPKVVKSRARAGAENKRDPDVVFAVASDEPTADEKSRPRSSSTGKPKKPAADSAAVDTEYYDGPAAMYPGPNPGYHPPRVWRKQGGWFIAGTEPAGPRHPIMPPPDAPPFDRYQYSPASGASQEIEYSDEPAAIFPEPTSGNHTAPPRVGRKSGSAYTTGAGRQGASSEIVPVPEPRSAPAKKPTTKIKSQKPPASRATKGTEYFDEPAAIFPGPKSSGPSSAVGRRSGGWLLTGAETDALDGEMIPTPESSDDSEPYMPFSHDDQSLSENGASLFGDDNSFVPYALPNRKWAVIAGAEGLLLRAHFSQATAMTQTTTTQSGDNTLINQYLVNFNPGYQGAFRAYLGFRDRLCGDEIRFAFLNFNSAQNLSATATANMSVCDFLCNTTPNPGDSVNTHFGLGVSLWDLDCVRPFFFTPQCQDPCGPKCHPWDLRWFVGVRAAYINHNISSTVTDATTANDIFAQASATNRFTGVGPRIGIQGRKFFGKNGRVSVYARGAGSLLLGNVYQDVINSTPNVDLPTTTNLVSRNSRIIPAADIEIGATWFVRPRFAVSSGWMLMSFWDLGLQETGSMSGLANANILGFDGFFVRGEFVF
jgi:hypothetical protein